LTLSRNAQKEFLIGQSSRSHATYRRPSLDGFYLQFVIETQYRYSTGTCFRVQTVAKIRTAMERGVSGVMRSLLTQIPEFTAESVGECI